jgi:hypothetical protein
MDRAQDATLTNRGTRQSKRATRAMACTTRRPKYRKGSGRRAASQRRCLSPHKKKDAVKTGTLVYTPRQLCNTPPRHVWRAGDRMIRGRQRGKLDTTVLCIRKRTKKRTFSAAMRTPRGEWRRGPFGGPAWYWPVTHCQNCADDTIGSGDGDVFVNSSLG